MSGINKMMDKMKQKKMTLDDLPSPTIQKEENHKKAVHTDGSKSAHTAVQPAVHKEVQPTVNTGVSTVKREVQQSVQHAVNTGAAAHDVHAGRLYEGNWGEQEPVNTETQNNRNTTAQQYSFGAETAKQQNRPVKKVTYYLTEEMHKAFEDVYARRILEGRKTDKSTLISEAVELLHKSEMAKYSNAS